MEYTSMSAGQKMGLAWPARQSSLNSSVILKSPISQKHKFWLYQTISNLLTSKYTWIKHASVSTSNR